MRNIIDKIKQKLEENQNYKKEISRLSDKIGKNWEWILSKCPHPERQWFMSYEDAETAVGECVLCGTAITKPVVGIKFNPDIPEQSTSTRFVYLDDGTEVEIVL